MCRSRISAFITVLCVATLVCWLVTSNTVAVAKLPSTSAFQFKGRATPAVGFPAAPYAYRVFANNTIGKPEREPSWDVRIGDTAANGDYPLRAGEWVTLNISYQVGDTVRYNVYANKRWVDAEKQEDGWKYVHSRSGSSSGVAVHQNTVNVTINNAKNSRLSDALVADKVLARYEPAGSGSGTLSFERVGFNDPALPALPWWDIVTESDGILTGMEDDPLYGASVEIDPIQVSDTGTVFSDSAFTIRGGPDSLLLLTAYITGIQLENTLTGVSLLGMLSDVGFPNPGVSPLIDLFEAQDGTPFRFSPDIYSATGGFTTTMTTTTETLFVIDAPIPEPATLALLGLGSLALLRRRR